VLFILCYSLRGEQGYYCEKGIYLQQVKGKWHTSFPPTFAYYCISVFNVVCMSRIVFKCYLKCVDPSSAIATPWKPFPCLGNVYKWFQMIWKWCHCKMFHFGYYDFKNENYNLNETPGWKWYWMGYVEWLLRATHLV